MTNKEGKKGTKFSVTIEGSVEKPKSRSKPKGMA
jgi:hypothetical protein